MEFQEEQEHLGYQECQEHQVLRVTKFVDRQVTLAHQVLQEMWDLQGRRGMLAPVDPLAIKGVLVVGALKVQ